VNIVFQIALISALSAAVFVATVVWSMRIGVGIGVPHEARRVLVAIERACWAALRRRAITIPWAATGTLGLIVVAHCALRPGSVPSPTAFAIVGAASVLLLGLVAGFAFSLFCGRHVRSRSFLIVAASAFSSNRCLTTTVSSAAVLAVAADMAGMLSTACVHGVLWLMARGMAVSNVPVETSLLVAIRIAPYFGIGAALAALCVSQTGAACVGVNTLAGSSTFEARTGLSAIDPRNPSVLVTAVASQLGHVVPRVLDSFVSSVLVSTLSFQVIYLAPLLGWSQGTVATALLPMMLRCFGLLASLSGLLTLRSSEHEDPGDAFVRGQIVAHVVVASALAGNIVWLTGRLSLPVVTAGMVGLLSPSVLGRVRSYLLGSVRLPRLPNDELKRQGLQVAADAVAAALRTALWPALLYPCLIVTFAFWLMHASTTPVERGAAILVGLAMPSALSAWNLAVSVGLDLESVGVLASSVGRIPLSADSTQRLRRLADGTGRTATATETIASDGGSVLCGLCAVVCQVSHARTFASSTSVATLLAASLWVFLPGLLATSAALKSAAKAARTHVAELDRQLRGMRRNGNQTVVPDDFVPSYRSSVELLARDSAHGRMAFAVLALALPLLIACLGAAVENTPGLAALGLASYAAIAAAAGLIAAHVGQAVAVASSLVHRAGPPSWLSASSPVVSVSEPMRLVEFLGQSLGVSVPLLTKAVALATLAFSAMLI